jgi:hypothetical protein
MCFESKIFISLSVDGIPYRPFLTAWGSKNAVWSLRVHGTDAFDIVAGVDGIHKTQICEVINIYTVF